MCPLLLFTASSNIPGLEDSPPPLPPSNPVSVVWSTVLVASELYSVAVAMLPLSAGLFEAPVGAHVSSGYEPMINSSEVCGIFPMSHFRDSMTGFAH